MPDISQDSRLGPWADILQQAHNLCMGDPSVTIGESLRRSIEEADVEVPENIERAMVRALGKLLFRGFPSDIKA